MKKGDSKLSKRGRKNIYTHVFRLPEEKVHKAWEVLEGLPKDGKSYWEKSETEEAAFNFIYNTEDPENLTGIIYVRREEGDPLYRCSTRVCFWPPDEVAARLASSDPRPPLPWHENDTKAHLDLKARFFQDLLGEELEEEKTTDAQDLFQMEF
jgi:hypothetical protein